MNISFPQKSAYDLRATSITFPVVVDGHTRRCFVTDEALMDHFGAASPDLERLQSAFDANRGEIEAVAEYRYRTGAAGDVLLRTQDF
jgi:hypothetical protein